MSNKFLVFDFETKDPYISLGLGAGWVFPLHIQNALSRVIGVSYCLVDLDTKEMTSRIYLDLDIQGNLIGTELDEVYQNISKFSRLIQKYKKVIAHNAQYDLGYLLTLGIDIKDLEVYDTKIIAQLYDNSLMSYSLDFLSKKYLKQKDQKDKGSLVDIVTAHKLIKMKPTCKSYYKRAMKFVYENMDVLQRLDFNTMAHYANLDTTATAKLFLGFIKKIPLETCHYWSNLQLICVKMRTKGISIDMDVVYKAIEDMTKERSILADKLVTLGLKEVNPDSPSQLAKALSIMKYKLPKTPTGALSVAKEFLDSLPEDELISTIKDYREVNKILNDFFIKIRDMQIYTCPEAAHGGKRGRVFPEMNVFGAITGRFSSKCPNIQQIPSRSPKYADLTRSMFIPDEGTQWVSLDWSNQEGRIALHYAVLINADGAPAIAHEWTYNPAMDLHQKVADLIGYGRKEAKAINLGLIYSKGEASLAKELKLPTVMEIDFKGRLHETGGPELKKLLAKYHKLNPWLKQLNILAKTTIGKKGGIITLGGRFSRREHPRFDYKALNKLVQGSAADQMYMALTEADRQGIPIICIVHDEFCIQGVENAEKMKKIMESVVELKVPMLAEVEVGSSWGTVEKLNQPLLKE